MDTADFNKQLVSLRDKLSYIAFNFTTNEEDAQDLLQETFLKAMKAKEKFRDDTNLFAWTSTIMKNTYINHYRRKSLYRKAFDDKGPDIAVMEYQKDMVQPASSYSEINEIVRMIDTIEDVYKIPFNMHVEGFKYKEIALKLNLKIGTVKSRIFFARKKLMSMIAS
jgi:RNA polymerase sigma-70 factor (ECF subfamily)